MKRRYLIELEIDSDETDITNTIRNKFKFDFKSRIVDIKNVKEIRTNPQNNSIHLWLDWIAKQCVEKGITLEMILEKRLEIMPTGILLKESLWKFTQKKMFNKKSTTQLNKTGEINDIIDVLTLHFSELGVEVPPFPDRTFLRDKYE